MPETKYLYEQGQTGKKIYAGQFDNNDWVSDLTGTALYTTIDKMRTDAIIAALETGLFMPILQAQYNISYDNEDLNKKNQAILDFINEDFSRLNWSRVFNSMLTAIPYGFSITEPVYILEAGKIRLRKLSARGQSTIWKWRVTPHGELKSVQQYVFVPDMQGENGMYRYIDLPADRIILYTHKGENGSLEGKPEYRPIYREWLIKDRLYRKMMVTIDRVGAGIPYALLKDNAPAGNADGSIKGAIDEVENVLKGLYASESAYFAAQYVESVGLLAIDPSAITTMQALIKHCDETMAKAMMQLYLNLGTSETGSRSLGNTFESLYYERIYSIAEELTDAINKQLIERYVRWNFGPQAEFPKMSLHFDTNLDAVTDILAKLKAAGLVQGNTDLENFVNTWYGLPLTTPANKINGQTITPVKAAGEPVTPAPAVLSDCCQLSDRKKGIQLNRQPTEKEMMLIDLEDTAGKLNTLAEQMTSELRAKAEPYAFEMAKQLGKGEKPYKASISWGNKIADVIHAGYKKLLNLANDNVKRELTKQKKSLSDRIMLAEGPLSQAMTDYDKWALEQSNIQSELLKKDLEAAVLKYYQSGLAEGLTGTPLTDYIMGKLIEEVGQRYESILGQVTANYGMARELSVQEFEDIVTEKIRTEIMDSKTCRHCQLSDGETYTMTDGEWKDQTGQTAPDLRDPMQNPCEGFSGGASCRGIYIYAVGGK